MAGEELARHGAHPAFLAIEALHLQAHALAAELLEMQAQGRNSEALERLGELHALRDALLEQLGRLIRRSQPSALAPHSLA
jgi:hypothetical protein